MSTLLLPENEVNMRWAAIVPIRKSVLNDDGSIAVDGIASDSSLDLQNEKVPQDLLEKSLPYLSQWGKLNWDHGKDDIGDVFEARRISADEAAQEFGLTVDPGGGTYIKGRIYPLGDAALAPEDLKTAHHRCQVGARLGFSLEGAAIRKSTGEIQAVLANRVALCPQAVNLNAVARVCKSLSEFFSGETGETQPEDNVEQNPDALILCPTLKAIEATPEEPEEEPGHCVRVSKGLWQAVFKAAMAAGSGVNAAEFTGGRALQREHLGKKLQQITKCPNCGHRFRCKAARGVVQ